MNINTSTVKEKPMRGLRALCCAAALVGLLAPGARADECTKQTFLTFSGPVALPTVTLPAGTYQFRLADPDSGRRTLQVWDQQGTKLYATLLTIPNEQLEASDDPVVMFSERPAGAPQAIKAWFYPGERIGQEFVYPKRQAMELASANHAPVMAFSDESADSSDAAKMHSAQVARVDGSNANGATTAANTADRSVTSATNDSQPATTTAQSTTAQSAATSAPAASTADQRSSAAAPAAASNSAAPSAAASTTASANSSAAQRAGQSANRTGASGASAVGTAGTTASNRQSANTAVGTSGQGNASTAQQNANQNSRPATGTAGARTLPRTASPLPLVGLLSGLMLAGGFAARQARKRSGDTL